VTTGLGGLADSDVRRLAEELDLQIRDEEIRGIRETVGTLLEGAADIHALPVRTRSNHKSRSVWWHPEETPWNAIVTRCEVLPVDSGPLDDVDVGIKDAIAVGGVPMGAGSDVMRDFVPAEDATVVRRLRAAGATITAKTNLDEFAGSGRGTTSVSGRIRNPNDPDRTAGGSSGGSAVAVATGEVDVAIGSDTGGSIRIPASFCGIVGLKPTYGLVPLSGAVENTYSQDTIGPMTSTVTDAATVLDAIAGRDPDDIASLSGAGRRAYEVADYRDRVDSMIPSNRLSAIRVGVLEEGLGEGVSDAVDREFQDGVDRLEEAGAEVRRVSVDHYEYFRPIKNVLSTTEIAAHWWAGATPLRRGGIVAPDYQTGFASRRSRSRGINSFYKAKLVAGMHLLKDDGGSIYTFAQAAREVLKKELEAALDGVDALVSPTMPGTAPRLESASDPGFDYARNTRPANVTRLPAITVPHGSDEGLPVGFQLVGGAFEEAELLETARAAETVFDAPSA